ncbi:MAG TPA: T9SS type A sorting domain-containing protein [Flavobacterium sp.]|jgi:uncharacterized repeat protein (TIGR01451 family)
MNKTLLGFLFLVISIPVALTAQPVCGGTFLDNGGSSGNYLPNTDQTYTICPTVPGDQVHVSFTSFNIEAGSDGLYVYDGNSTSDPLISSGNSAGSIPGGMPGAYWGSIIPGPFISSSVDGCLTFRFRSDASGNLSGWEAEVSCNSEGYCVKPTALTLSNVTPTSLTFGWTDPMGFANPFEVLVLPCGSAAPSQSSTGVMAESAPFTVTGLTPDTCYDLYVRTWCGSNSFDTSMWAGPISTMPSDVLSCGEAFYDNGGSTDNYIAATNQTTTICPDNAGEVVRVTFNSFSTEAGGDGLYVFNGDSELAPQFSSSNDGGGIPGAVPGSFWGTTIPGPFQSTSPDGCLTFLFRTNGSAITGEGWAAQVECFVPDAILIAFIDGNGNNIKDSSEADFSYGTFEIENTTASTTTTGYSPVGYYSFSASPGDAYNLNFAIDDEYSPYFTLSTVATYEDVVFPSATPVFYFPVTMTTPFNDVQILMMPLNPPVPGMVNAQSIYYRNVGITPASGTITFTKDPLTTMTGVNQPGFTTTPTGLTLDYSNLQPGEWQYFVVNLTVPTIPTISLGDFLTNSATISTQAVDINLGNNSTSVTQEIVGSYDPNDIMESHGPEIVYSVFTEDDYLFYTIRFQNTGTANALTVRVENQLDDQLDPSTIQMVRASHNYTMTKNGDLLTWQFDDIQLPPESTDAEGSNGFITYRVKPNPGYAIGDIIPNTADIYFDFNPAIVTNTFETEFVQQLSNAGFNRDTFQVYPNPATNTIFISSHEPQTITNISIHDVLGKLILEVAYVSENQSIVDVSGLSPGIYTVTIATSDSLKTVKKLIIR